MKSEKIKIAFCFPYKGVGGVSLLFARVAAIIAKNDKYEVFVIDYKDGYMAMNRNGKVNLLDYSSTEKTILPGDMTIVFQTMTPWSIFPYLDIHDDAKLFFWNCHPYNLVPHVPFIDTELKKNKKLNKLFIKTIFYNYWKKCNKFLKLLIEKNAIAFMDNSNKSNTEFFYFPLRSDKILPIPAVLPDENKVAGKLMIKGAPIRMTWLGRLVDFKYYILKYTLIELNKISEFIDSDIIFTVIGGGEWCARLKSEIGNLKSITIIFVENVSPNDLDNYLNENCDLMFAMGTSALEAAKLSIPTVLLDVVYGEIKGNYQYRFLFERDGSTLGDVIDVKDLNTSINKSNCAYNPSLLNILEKVQTEYDVISVKTNNYFMKNHEIEKICGVLTSKLTESKCTYNDLKLSGCLEQGFLYRLSKRFG